MTEALLSKLPKEGSKIIVRDKPKNGSMLPKSTGFMCGYDIHSGMSNIVKAIVIINRKGKGGIQRMEFKQIFLPIYSQGSLEKVMVEAKPRGIKNYVTVECAEGYNRIDVGKLSSVEFISWTACKIWLLQSICSWYNDRKGFINDHRNVLVQIKNLAMLKETGGNLLSICEASARSSDSINDIMIKLREAEASTSRSLLRYHKSMLAIHSAALAYILAINKGPDGTDKCMIPEKIINTTMHSIASDIGSIDRLIFQSDH